MGSSFEKRLKNILSIPTFSGQENNIKDYITFFLENIDNIHYEYDEKGNLYITKGKLLVDEYYPLLIAHLDTVHDYNKFIYLKEEFKEKVDYKKRDLYDSTRFKSFKGYKDENFTEPTGCGGDDKAGVFIILEILKRIDKCKICFFVEEECGGVGSSNFNENFLIDVGYILSYDAPGDLIISEYSLDRKLFDKTSFFGRTLINLFQKNMGNIPKLDNSPFTDIYNICELTNVSSVNFPCGYYNLHTENEYVIINDVYNLVCFGVELIDKLGFELYLFNNKSDIVNNTIYFGKDIDSPEIIETSYHKFIKSDNGVIIEDKENKCRNILDNDELEFFINLYKK